MTHTNTAARYFGIFFILTFLSYGIGSAMVDAVTSETNFQASLEFTKSGLIIGAILMAVVHTALNIGLAAIMFSVLSSFSRFFAVGYFGLAIVGTTTLVIGVVFLLMLLPIHDMQSFSMGADTLATLMKRGAYYSYQLGMAIWGMGGLILVYLLFKSRLVPQVLAVFGSVGYAIFIAGTIAEISGLAIGVMLSLPGGLFEISLSLWLIFKGFNTSHIPADISRRFAVA